jgi:hypothetical protein
VCPVPRNPCDSAPVCPSPLGSRLQPGVTTAWPSPRHTPRFELRSRSRDSPCSPHAPPPPDTCQQHLQAELFIQWPSNRGKRPALGYRGLLPRGVKWPGRQVDHSPTSEAIRLHGAARNLTQRLLYLNYLTQKTHCVPSTKPSG